MFDIKIIVLNVALIFCVGALTLRFVEHFLFRWIIALVIFISAGLLANSKFKLVNKLKKKIKMKMLFYKKNK